VIFLRWRAFAIATIRQKIYKSSRFRTSRSRGSGGAGSDGDLEEGFTRQQRWKTVDCL
jgi:hypothetical protein